jgi:Fur family ferric uptake transcriptional regulator
LATVGQRSTRQRAAILSALADSANFLTAQDLHDSIRRQNGSVGLSTVYRSLQSMAETGEIDVILKPDGEALYRHCGQSAGHHHHLVCRDCGMTVEVEGPTVERWTESVAKAQGFTNVSHTLDIFGTCAKCSRRKNKRART